MSNLASISKLLGSALFFLSPFTIADTADTPWERIAVPSRQYTVEVNDVEREISPGCALPGDDYSFYFKKGKKDKLVIYFNGGGACWDFNTCVASLQTPAPTYVPSDDLPHNMPENQQGIFDLNNKDNPYRKWSILYLPNCTGDVYIGSKDARYQPFPGAPSTTIRHRGFDNFLFAREWLKERFDHHHKSKGLKKVVVAGSSAGGYGAVMNYPYIKKAFPNAKGYLMADGSSGVFTDSFMQTVFQSANSAWGVNANIADWVPGLGVATTLNADSFVPAVYASLSSYYTKDKFSQYTTVWDAVQVMFYNIMLHTDQMPQWPNLTPELFAAWTTTMQGTAYMNAAAPNYRFYIAPGCQHTILRDEGLYSSSAVGGVTVLEWLSALTKKKRRSDWDNLSCTNEGCLAPLTPEQVVGCLM